MKVIILLFAFLLMLFINEFIKKNIFIY